ncbi:MAG: alpha/beta fold hydrolase [Clostridia bacterium]|nr:alpha/beta fold hydrolase [Clostridia bacterium]
MVRKILAWALVLCMLATCALAEPAYQPGTYEATEAGFGGDVTVTMTFDENGITDVQIVGDAETEGVGSKAIEGLPAAILEAQSADVEGVSGASFTSKAILVAAQDCIDQAKGVSGEVAVKMKPGEYVGQGIGFRISEPVTVTVTVGEDKIENIVVDQENISDTKAMVQTVVDTLVPRMLEYQSVSVDAVCGATATSNGVRQAAEAALVQAITAAGGDAKDVKAFYHSIPQVDATEELSADVLVIGLGGSGMASALSAAENGLNVLAIDKAAKFGGNAVLTSGPMAINVPSQVAAEIPEWTDPTTKEVITKKAGDDLIDKEALYQAWLEYTTNDEGEQQAKPEMVRLFLDESGYTDDWLTQYGFQFDPASGFAGNAWAAYTPISGGKKLTEGFFAECMENFVKLGGEYMLETEAYDLIVEDGKVVGAKAHSMVDGREYVIRAKAVVLATGGFAGSGEMEEKYLENTYFPLKGEWKLFGMHQDDGKMLEAAIQNGAATYNISVAPMVHVGGVDGFLPGFETVPVEGEIGYATGRPAVWSQGDLPLNMAISSDTLAVGKDAKRFTAETALSMFNPWISGPHFYSIYGNDQVQKLKTEGFDEVPYGPSTNYLGYGTSIPAGVPMDNADAVLQAAIDAGYVFRADTVAELAGQMGLDPEALEATVEAYNAACEAGEDAEFGKDPKYLKPITGAPYIGIVGSSWCYSTCGGLDVNEKFQVLNTEGQPIEGLYAVGTDSMGVLFSETKAYVTYGGGAMGYAFTSGRLVGADIAEALSYTEENIVIPGEKYDIPATVCIPAGEGPFPAVVMLHGTGSNRDEAGNGYKYAAPVLAAKYGIATIRIDFPGNGDSTADYMEYNFKSAVADAKAAADYMAGLDAIKGDAIGVMGWSQGGTDALLACAWEPETFKSIVTWAGAPDMMLDGFFAQADYDEAKENGFFVMEFDWRDNLNVSLDWCDDVANTDVLAEFEKGYDGPVLAIAGTNDDTVDPVWSEKIAAASSNEKSATHFIEGMDHTFNVFAEEDLHSLYDAVDATGAFFAETLG